MSSIIPIPPGKRSWIVFTILTVSLSFLTFYSLSNHLLDAYDDRDHMIDTPRILEDWTYMFSATRLVEVRPPVDLLFLFGHTLWQDDPKGYHLLQVMLHLVATLLLAYTFSYFGADLELSFFSALLFLVNLAHFRAIHQITCMTYTLSLSLSLSVLISYARFLDTRQFRWMVGAVLLCATAIFSHPSAIFVVLFCFYRTFRHCQSLKKAVALFWPFALASVFFLSLAYVGSTHGDQVKGLSNRADWFQMLINPFWYLGRLISSAHWITPATMVGKPHIWEIGVGVFYTLGVFLLFRKRLFPVADWALWSVVAVLPFVNYPLSMMEMGPSRQVYFASAGTSFVLVWSCRVGVTRVMRGSRERFRGWVFCVLVFFLTASGYVFLKRSEAISYYRQGKGYIAVEDYATGIDRYERAIARGPDVVPADIFLRLATASLSEGRFPVALIEQELVRQPDSPRLNMLKSISAYLQSDPEAHRRAEARVLQAFEMAQNPDLLRREAAHAYLNLGYHFQMHQKYDRSIELFRKALQLYPDYLNARFNLGYAFQKTGQLDRARTAYQQVLKLDPGSVSAYINLGVIHYQQKAFTKARSAFEQALGLDPKNIRIYLGLARAYEKTGRPEDAVRTYQKALSLNPNSPEARQGLKALQSTQ